MEATAQTSIRTASALDFAVGLWLIIAPFALNYSATSAASNNDLIIGLAVAIIAGVRLASTRSAWTSWVGVFLGVWLVVAPFVLGYSAVTNALWNDMIAGIAVAVLATWSMLATPTEENQSL